MRGNAETSGSARAGVCVRPATTADAEQAAARFPDLLPDRWREGGNRRAFVAVTADGAGADTGPEPGKRTILGHCRGHDNAYHPGSRLLELQILPVDALPPGVDLADVEDALLRAQIAASGRPLRMKIYAGMHRERELAIRHGGIAVQVTPPWRYVIGPELREWADAHQAEPPAEVRAIGEDDRESVRDLEAEHYVAQHAAWSPSAPVGAMRELFAESHDPASEETYDPQRSVVLVREGEICAAALLWPFDEEFTGREVTLLSRPYVGPHSRADKEACLAALIGSGADGESLLVDSHLTEQHEAEMMREIPGLVGSAEDWMAITAIPVSKGPAPIPFPRALIPEEAPWVAQLLPGAGADGL